MTGAASSVSVVICSIDAAKFARVTDNYRSLFGTTPLVTGKWESAGDPHAFVLISAPDPDSVGYVTVLGGGGPLVVPRIPALDGVFMAMRRSFAVSVPFDEALFDHFHLYDLDFSFRAYQAGFALAVCRDIVLIHQSIGNFDAVWDKYQCRF